MVIGFTRIGNTTIVVSIADITSVKIKVLITKASGNNVDLQSGIPFDVALFAT